MTKFNTNDSSASTDDAAGEANVSPMAPFHEALHKMEAERTSCMKRYWQSVDEKDADSAEGAGQSRWMLAALKIDRCQQLLLNAIREATDSDETGGRSSTPSG